MNSYMLYLDSQNVNVLPFYFSGFFIANKIPNSDPTLFKMTLLTNSRL